MRGSPALLRTVLLALLLASPGSVRADERGWGYLIHKLIADGVDRDRVVRTFSDPRVAPFDGLYFSLHPRESHALYRGFLLPRSVAAARRCYLENAVALDAAEKADGVPASVVAAILQIESGCVRHMGSAIVLPRLARLAMANEPANLRANIERLTFDDPDAEPLVRARARYLENTFYPEVLATFTVAQRMGIEPLALRGSEGGAFGGPQFLPKSYLDFGVDGDRDGRVDLYEPADAAASCARYLAQHGWHPGLSRAERRSVIWTYNRSDAYVDTVLELARRIEQPGSSDEIVTARASRRRPTPLAKRPVRKTRRARTA